MCCEADWKREIVPDHKWDFVHVREFHRTDIWTRFKYILKYVFLLKGLAVYGLDIFTAITMISTDHWTNAIASKCGNNCAVNVQFSIAKWIFVGCIIFSFLLLGYEGYKAKQVVDSRDISYAFTNLMANDYFSFKNYDNFCLFCYIDGSTKQKDNFAFWIFFTFKDWKRLLLADGPRQSINALILYSFAYANGFQTSDIPAYWNNSAVTAMLLFSQIITVAIFAISLILLIAAGTMYVPLLCYIQGNLKEYVCHKVDKRISEIIKKKQRQRIARNIEMEKRAAKGDVKLSKSDDGLIGLPQPTLPSVDLDEDDLAMRSKRRAKNSGMNRAQEYETYEVYTAPVLPYQRSNSVYSANEYDASTTRLTDAAAPLGNGYPPNLYGQPPPVPHSSSNGSLTHSTSGRDLRYQQPQIPTDYNYLQSPGHVLQPAPQQYGHLPPQDQLSRQQTYDYGYEYSAQPTPNGPRGYGRVQQNERRYSNNRQSHGW